MTTVLDPKKEGFKTATPKGGNVQYKIVTETQQVNTPDGTATAHEGDVLVIVGDREQITHGIPKDRTTGREAIPETRVRVPVVEVMTKESFAALYDAK